MIEKKNLLAEWRSDFRKTKIYYSKFDITKKSEIATTFQIVCDYMGHIDVLINSAGMVWKDNVETTITINLVLNIRNLKYIYGPMRPIQIFNFLDRPYQLRRRSHEVYE